MPSGITSPVDGLPGDTAYSSTDSAYARSGLGKTSTSSGRSTREAPAIVLNGAAVAGDHGGGMQGNSSNDTANAGDGELWSSILNSVTSSRATPVKNVIVLGHARAGKSTLLSNLASSSSSGFVSDAAVSDEQTSPDPNTGAFQSNGQTETTLQAARRSASADLGLGYGYFDVGDDDEEDTVARVGVYQVNSSHPSSLSLLPFALLGGRSGAIEKGVPESVPRTKPTVSIDGLRDSLFMIVLDWEAPWDFLSQLVEWLDVIREIVQEASGNRSNREQNDSALQELRENVESYIRHYSEPSAASNGADTTQNGAVLEDDDIGEISTASAIVAVSNPTGLDDDERTPLPQGCLTHNFGVPIVVVCTKSDTITQLERQRTFKEEQFDYIQQVLRTICLKYGAGLFSTAQTRPQSFDVLRQYLLHRLFGSARQHSATGAFRFRHRASTVERDVLLVPAGWDSFGKIRALRDGFDCASTANGWEWDAQVERIRRQYNLPKGAKEAEERAEAEVDRRTLPDLDTDGGAVGSALKQYEDIVEDWDVSAPTTTAGNARVKDVDDQSFLQHHYATLQREPDPRTRGGARNAPSLKATSAATGGPRSIVGPMGSASLSLPSVERAMQDRQLNDDASRASGAASTQPITAKPTARRDPALLGGAVSNTPSGRGTPTAILRGGPAGGGITSSSTAQSPSLGSSDRQGSRPTSPLSAGAGGGMSPSIGTPKQSEVLHSFFQSLLKEKPASGGGSAGGGGAAALARSSQPSGRSGSSQSGGGGGGRWKPLMTAIAVYR